jgi:ribosomal protein S18 acetylase RimI-like enzyme
MQFHSQTSHYNEHFSLASFNLIVLDVESIGRFYVDRQNVEIRIIDIALLPHYCNRGIGTELLSELIAEAKQQSVPLRIHVEHNNPALNLYQRMGFKKVKDTGVYFLMEANALVD